MSNLTLNFFGELIKVDKPKSLSSLRNEISQLLGLETQDTAEIILTYDKNGEKITISSDEELKTFLNTKLTKINLEISQNSKIYKDNLNKLKEQNLKDKKALEELLKKKKELKSLKETKFIPLKEELKEIESKLFALFQRKNDIKKTILEETKQIEKEEKENNQKIQEIQKKLGILNEKSEKTLKVEKEHPQAYPCYIGKRHNMPPNKNQLNIQYKPNPSPHVHPCFFPRKYHIHPNKKQLNIQFKPNPCPHVHPCFFPKKYHIHPNKKQLNIQYKPNPCPHVHPCFFPKKYHIHPNKKQLKVNFAKTEYIDIPKDLNTTKTEPNESNNDLDLKMKTIDDWGKCLLLKTQELSNKLAEKFKDLPTLKISTDIYNDMNKEEDKEEKLKSNKKVENKTLYGMRPENVPKKNNLCPTKGNMTDNEKKPEHFGVKCDQCGVNPIVGCRYKCAVCPNFDYCEECEQKFAIKHNHAFFKITDPSMRPLISKNFFQK